MIIIEYNKNFEEDVKDLLVELEEYIVGIDEDHLDIVGPNYRKEILKYDQKEIDNNKGIIYIAVDNDHAIGVIMGITTKYEDKDHLDYKCPTSGRITELVVNKSYRHSGIGKLLMDKMEDYFKRMGCEYIHVDVFAYNHSGVSFYERNNYHPRMYDMIKKI